MDWNALIDEDGLVSLLPDAQAHYALPVKEGLTVFLSGLPDQCQQEILARQAALGPSASLSQRLGQLARACPVLHKLGQTLARNQWLAPELREQLQPLESLPPTVSLELIQQILLQELGPLDRRRIQLAPPAIAEASVAVVVPFEERGASSPRQGVFKLLKPGIEERLELELDLLSRVGAHLDQRCDEFRIPHLDYGESFEQVKNKLACEVRLDKEQRHLAMAKEFYADDQDVLIPALFDHCTSRVTAMQFVAGVKVTDHHPHSPRARRRLATLVARALVSRPIFAKSESSLFHCDPHAGNLLLTVDGRLAILDWSLVSWLSEQDRSAMMQLVLAAVMLNGAKSALLVQSLAERGTVDARALQDVVRDWLQRLRRGQLPGLSWLVGLLDDAAQIAGLRVSADMMLFRKSLLTLQGVTSALSASDNQIDDVLLVDFLHHFAAELPERWRRSPGSREFATHISNADLLELSLSWPLAAWRFWLDDRTRVCPQDAHASAVTGLCAGEEISRKCLI